MLFQVDLKTVTYNNHGYFVVGNIIENIKQKS